MSTHQVFPALATARLDLRRLAKADAPALFDLFRDEEVLRYYDARPYPDVAAAERQVEAFDERFRQGTGIRWGFAHRANGTLLGHGGLMGLDAVRGTGTIGFVLARSTWGQGFGAEAVGAVLAFSADRIGLRRLEAEVRPGNDRSERLLRRLGFVRGDDRVRDLFGSPATFQTFAWTAGRDTRVRVIDRGHGPGRWPNPAALHR